jgi:isopentenyl phosphate kinase
VITDKRKAFVFRKNTLKRLVHEIRIATKDKKADIIVAHGSGSFGHTVAHRYKTQDGVRNKKSLAGAVLVRQAAGALHEKVLTLFLADGIPAVSFAPGNIMTTSGRKIESVYLNSLKEALRSGTMPILSGDVVFDEKQGFCIYSAEKVLLTLARSLSKEYKLTQVFLCGDTDGVYDSAGKTVPRITPQSFRKLRKTIRGSSKTDVTGGMLHKIETTIELVVSLGVPSVVLNGNRPNALRDVLVNKDMLNATRIEPDNNLAG